MYKISSFFAALSLSLALTASAYAQAFTAKGMTPESGLTEANIPAEIMRLQQRANTLDTNTLPQLQAEISQVHEKVKRNQASLATLQQSLLNENTPEGAIEALRQEVRALTARIEALEAQRGTAP